MPCIGRLSGTFSACFTWEVAGFGLMWRMFVTVYMTVSQTDVHSERIDEPVVPEVWLKKVETPCYSSVLRR